MDPSAIQRTSVKPFDRQIHALIRAGVTGAGYALDAPIATERRPAPTFDLSRVTVRHAIALLAAEGPGARRVVLHEHVTACARRRRAA